MTALLGRPPLQDHPFMSGANEEFVNQLAGFGNETRFGPGEPLFPQGGYADKFYLLLEGEVEIEASSEDRCRSARIQTLQPGEVVGWSWLFPPYVWHFSATARTPCVAIEFNAPGIMVHAEEHPAFGFELMKRLMPHVIKRLASTSEKLLELQPRIEKPARKKCSNGCCSGKELDNNTSNF